MKRIAVFLDGTWNNDRDGTTPTNIVRLHQLLPQTDTAEQLKPYYSAGVGAEGDVVNHWLGGALGVGLSDHVMAAYRYLAKNYSANDRDEIYIFGFSRGAFTARSLAGFIGASGLLTANS